MDIPWDDIQLFLAVAEAGSVSGAARLLRLGQPTVSRRLALLEYHVGQTLFRRSVGGVALTVAGERLLAPARRMAEWSGEVGRAADSTDRTVKGLVRVTTSPYVAFTFLAPFAGWLQTKHPGLRLEVLSGMEYLDLARGEADLALRLRPPDHADLALVTTLRHANAVFVAKSLAKTLPKKPRFRDLPWVAWAAPWDSLQPNPALREAIPGFVPAFTSDSFLVKWSAAEAGVGAMVLGRIHHRFSRPTSLVPLPIDLGPYAKGELHVVCARSALDTPRIRLVAQLIEAELKKMS